MSRSVQPLLDALARRRDVAKRARASVRGQPRRETMRVLRAAVRDVRMTWLRTTGRMRRTTTIVRQLPAFGGTFELDLRSDLTSSVLSVFEPELAELVKLAVDPDADVLDVGANCGLYTVLLGTALASSRHVLAVEPAPAARRLLHANIAKNGLGGRVIVYEGIASDRAGIVALNVREGKDEYASIGAPSHPNAPRDGVSCVAVPAETLDRLVETHRLAPGLVKIDVEGAEGLALSGARRLLAEQRPVLISELDDRLLAGLAWTAGRVIGLLASHGYGVWDVLSGAALGTDTQNFVGEIVAVHRRAR